MSIRIAEDRELPPALVRAINRYLLVNTEIRPADLCLVFGGRRSAEARVSETVRLWRHGFFNLIVVTGGRPELGCRTEAGQMVLMLLDRGVPEEQLLVEERSRNTGENVLYSMELLRRLGVLRLYSPDSLRFS